VLSLQKVGLSYEGSHLIIEHLGRSLNIETVRLDFNLLNGKFIREYEDFLKKAQKADGSARQSPILEGSESEASFFTTERVDQRSGGLVNLSLEGNPIGDEGARAIGDLIQTVCDASRGLKHVNLNGARVRNAGFEALKDALLQRGQLASNFHLTHVKVTLERNQ